MIITADSMDEYRMRLSALNEKAFAEALKYIQDNNYDIDSGFIDFAHGLTTKYGEAAAELSCQMYDELHEYWKRVNKSKKAIKPAEPAEVPTRSEVEKAVYGTLKTSVNEIPGTVSRLVKQTAEDTKIKNGMRDGAEFAWIPAGDTCAFCLTLASRGWQKISKKTLKNGHAAHIHAHCDCTYTVRFDHKTEVEGYDPQVYRDMWDSAEGRNSKEKMRSMRKSIREEHKKEDINVAQLTNKNGKLIEFEGAIAEGEKFESARNLISELANTYNTRLERVTHGAEKAAGDVDMSGSRMRLNTAQGTTVLHEFAHTLANSLADKYGITDDSAFWKEMRKVMREYHKDVDSTQDVRRWISVYEHSSRNVDEFMCEAFAHAKAKELGIDIPTKYGEDFTYSNKVLEIINKYFKR